MSDDLSITESGVTFTLRSDHTCVLDKIDKRRLQHLKTCEFVTLRAWTGTQALLYVEAKSSSPHPERSRKDFERLKKDLTTKFTQSLLLHASTAAGRHEDRVREAFPDVLLDPAVFGKPILLIVVFPEHPAESLPDIAYRLRTFLERLTTATAIAPADVVLLNRDLARKAGLIN